MNAGIRAAHGIACGMPIFAADLAAELRDAIKPAELIARCTGGAVSEDVRSSVDRVLQIVEALVPPTDLPDGTPNVRDVNAPCCEFVPGPPQGICRGDGHYLCRECREYDTSEEGE